MNIKKKLQNIMYIVIVFFMDFQWKYELLKKKFHLLETKNKIFSDVKTIHIYFFRLYKISFSSTFMYFFKRLKNRTPKSFIN